MDLQKLGRANPCANSASSEKNSRCTMCHNSSILVTSTPGPHFPQAHGILFGHMLAAVILECRNLKRTRECNNPAHWRETLGLAFLLKSRLWARALRDMPATRPGRKQPTMRQISRGTCSRPIVFVDSWKGAGVFLYSTSGFR